MKLFAKLHFSFLLTLWGILFLSLTACGVRGPLYLPPPPPTPEKPKKIEPLGVQYPSSPESSVTPPVKP
ncbi:MAG: lipoprotein [Betaproteobacteria bacterium]|jgi:predicted small lipoprotein YifL